MKITAKVKTVLKKHNVDSGALPAAEKRQVAVDESFPVSELLIRERLAQKVRLGDSAGDWWIFAPHWSGLPEDLLLNTPYFSQRDNYKDEWRTCFSSSCAMLVATLKPGVLTGPRGDDEYVREVFKRGDTVDSQVQIRTLAHFGVNAKFMTDLTFADVDKHLEDGVPVPVGILHHGPGSHPTNDGGHWICVVGRIGDGASYIVNDPWGELDHPTGTYPSQNGQHVHYSRQLLQARWTVNGPKSGWGILAKK